MEAEIMRHELLPADDDAILVGRAERPSIGPCLVAIRDGVVIDITTREAPTMRDLLELGDPAGHVRSVPGEEIGGIAAVAQATWNGTGGTARLLAPCDLQALKACGVTFARSMLERVIEERAGGDPTRAEAVRAKVTALVGDSLRSLKPGSPEAAKVKAALIEEGIWSQYLEVGIGPDAEVFTKSQPMSSVGWGARIGLHPISTWNNPEPEIVLAVNSKGRICGATLGNDVNLRDIEGRSALLLGKSKDNNASCSIGPFIRLIDDRFTLDSIRAAEIEMTVEGEKDGFKLSGRSSMSEISRDPVDLVSQTIGRHHQYPDGFMLFLGTMFAPTEDRGTPGEGFTHKLGDVVTMTSTDLGSLVNVVDLSTKCPEWVFGVAALMRNLAGRVWL
jgi:fumarylacetoacetate (FAA) hydrolase family protein